MRALGSLVVVAAVSSLAGLGCHASTDAVDAVDVSPDEGVSSDGAAEGGPIPTLPAELTGGFVDLSDGITPWPPFEVSPGVPSESVVPEVTYGVFADLDGDGAPEVILSGDSNRAGAHRQIYRYEGPDAGLVPVADDPLGVGGVSLAEDLDGDGFVDLLMLRPTEVVLRWGDATGQWLDETVLAPDALIGEGERTAFHLTDLDQDGWLDLLMRAECGLMVLMRTGPRTFEPRPEVLAGYETTTPYAIGVWPLRDEPPVVMVMGHPVCGTYVSLAVDALDEEGFPVLEPIEVLDLGDARDAPLSSSFADAAPMGAAVSDLNRDGALDLFMTLDPAHAIFDGAEPWPMTSLMADTGLLIVPSATGRPQVGWGVALLDLDRDGLEDVLTAHGNDRARSLGREPDPGPQWVSAHWNAGDFTFVDATTHLGLERPGGWRALAVGDLDGDQDADLVVGGLGEPPRVYRNDVESPWHGFALRLRGHTSNRLGIGARVVVVPSGTAVAQHHAMGGMASPKVASSPALYPGLGAAESADVTVTWPSGVVQTLDGLSAGESHVIDEPAVLTVEPAGRRLPAGGSEVATLTVIPPSPAVDVHATITHGDGVPAPAVEGPDGVWRLTIAPPPGPGSARVEVWVDGEPLGIRPRLWWEAP